MRITRDRMVNVLEPAPKPRSVWQEDFDYNDEVLLEMARIDWDQIGPQHLSYYFLDLAFVELQPDLLRHVFPACLKFWYETLLQDKAAASGQADFHFALVEGEVAERMLSAQERNALNAFLVDGLLDRIEATGSLHHSDPGWIARFNSLGFVAPVILQIWEDWWLLDSPGKALSAVQYASGLVYRQEENPLHGAPLASNDSWISGRAWRNDNLTFLREVLTVDHVRNKLHAAATALWQHPEAKVAGQIAADAGTRGDTIRARIGDLLANLSSAERPIRRE
ncbi:MAG: hypothetical protein J0H49_09690 [Acidobacteria bacterium]|nr:hypothetical protein [Acidobacteriota bacterium]